MTDSVRLHPLSLVDEGDHVIVGDTLTGRFVAMPPVGAVVIRALQAGADLSEARAAGERFVGQDVDVAAFVETLRRLGFIEQDVDRVTEWRQGPRRRVIRHLFGRTAWLCYTAALAWSVGCLVAIPDLRPRGNDVIPAANAGAHFLIFLLCCTVVTALHECWHWLAAHAAGIPARLSIGNRLYFVVFETDLSHIWRLPRRQRYGPVLAGLAADSTVLALLLAVRAGAGAGYLALPPSLLRFAATLTYVVVAVMAWQCLIFLRTDLYAVLVIATGCRNLWRVKTLLLRRALGLLRQPEQAELAAANDRDIRVGSWFRWVWLAGLGLAVAWYWMFYLPVLVGVIRWTTANLATGPASAAFWYALGCLALLLWAPALLVAKALSTPSGVARRWPWAGRP